MGQEVKAKAHDAQSTNLKSLVLKLLPISDIIEILNFDYWGFGVLGSNT